MSKEVPLIKRLNLPSKLSLLSFFFSLVFFLYSGYIQTSSNYRNHSPSEPSGLKWEYIGLPRAYHAVGSSLLVFALALGVWGLYRHWNPAMQEKLSGVPRKTDSIRGDLVGLRFESLRSQTD